MIATSTARYTNLTRDRAMSDKPNIKLCKICPAPGRYSLTILQYTGFLSQKLINRHTKYPQHQLRANHIPSMKRQRLIISNY